MGLEGRNAVVTGAARGIGQAIAARFVSEGARVAIWDIDGAGAEAAAERLGGGTHAVAVDVTDAAAIEAALGDTIGALGGIDILVNNAGISGPNKTTWEYTPEEWRAVLELEDLEN